TLHYEKRIYYQEELHRLGQMLSAVGITNIKQLEEELTENEMTLALFQKHYDDNAKNVIELLTTYLVCRQGDKSELDDFFLQFRNKRLKMKDIDCITEVLHTIDQEEA